MSTITICELYRNPEKYIDKEIFVQAWVKTVRGPKTCAFVEVNDGSFFKAIQIVCGEELSNFAEIKKTTIGSAIESKGKFVKSMGKGQAYEIQATEFNVIGLSSMKTQSRKNAIALNF